MRIKSGKALYYRPATAREGFKVFELRRWSVTVFGTDLIVTKFPCGTRHGALREVDMRDVDFIKAHKMIAENLRSFVTTHLHGESEDVISEGKRPNLTGDEDGDNYELERILFTQRWIADHERRFEEKDYKTTKIEKQNTGKYGTDMDRRKTRAEKDQVKKNKAKGEKKVKKGKKGKKK